MYEALRGVKGFVIDGETGQPVGGVQLRVAGRDRDFNTTRDGEYWRILLNGSYTLEVIKTETVLRVDYLTFNSRYSIKVSAEGYEPMQVPFQVMGDEATILNVTLRRLAVSLSSPPSLVSVSSWLVEDPVTTSMTLPTDSSFTNASSGDGYPSTLHPTSTEYDYTNATMTTVQLMVRDESIGNNSSARDDPDDDEDSLPLDSIHSQPVISGATWTFAGGGGCATTPLSLMLTSCTFVWLSLTLHD